MPLPITTTSKGSRQRTASGKWYEELEKIATESLGKQEDRVCQRAAKGGGSLRKGDTTAEARTRMVTGWP